MVKYLRSEDGLRFVSLEKIREFDIFNPGFERWVLRAYLLGDDYFRVRTFKTKEEAQTWLELHLSNA